MIIAKVVKDFREAKNKDGKRLIGFTPKVGTQRRFNKQDFEILNKLGLVEEVGVVEKPKKRGRPKKDEGAAED